MSVVGGRLDSYTTHVFWVKNDTELITAWETALRTLGDIIDSDTKAAVTPEARDQSATVSELNKGVKASK
mgnify:FL=1|nr:MAG TPA: hypothetical protein [Crassvirales sp.]